MKERDLTVTELAKGLGMSRANLSAIINERSGFSPEQAVQNDLYIKDNLC